MPSRFIVSCAARAVGMTTATPASAIATRTSVAMASISGTMMSGCSCSIRRFSATGSDIVIT